MNTQRALPLFKWLIAGVGLVIVLLDTVFSFFLKLGPIYGRMIPAGLCALTLVILAPAVLRGSRKSRLLAASMTVLPAVLLLIFVVGLVTMLLQR